MSINPLYLSTDLDTQTGNRLFHHGKYFLNGTASFRKQNLLHTSTEGKSVLFRLFLRKHTRDKTVGMPEALTVQLGSHCPAEIFVCHQYRRQRYTTMKYRYCNLILDLSRYMLSILENGNYSNDPHTACFWVESGWGVEGVGSCPLFSVELASSVSAVGEGSELLTTPPFHSISACLPTKLPTSSILLCKSNFGGNFGTIDKK